MASLASRLAAGGGLLTSWIGIPEPLLAEASARAGFDCVTLDMQHGLWGPEGVMRGLGAVVPLGKPALVRVPVGDFAMASRALDMGAEGVIAPMINSVADAKAFVAAMKFPPLGARSWGPTRAFALTGETDANAYLARANRETVAFAMIETREALAALGDILAVDGIDGVFVGPSDLSITLAHGAAVDQRSPAMEQAARDILVAVRAAGKWAGIFAITPAQAIDYRALGYDFVALGTDSIYLRLGMTAMLDAVRPAG
ncbi:HpcH/HpaI aldolase family protein [Prosthecomicrobium pneumaticum]|uniref:4-hydroxy-2-oxoheptanedioate aldolase n=1 Tax=Prosthecomicrobium pneumaticum TaxID=81895 RepID=A0A7W9FPK0_9HYPH|nr:aldolase/citrate lyase family protein [Prosthecomicrobium pneumaticum]MBB5754534.1 4-hydroxy-2-oxoheptanedioate aldolase [Prosthecomicrobium pneumaticum]